MSATEPFSHLIGIKPQRLSPTEKCILEAELFICICQELQKVFKSQHNIKKENKMIEENFIRYIIDDILLTEEYSLQGIAYHTHIPEDVICDVVAGKNTRPSLHLSHKLIELHRSVKPHLYKEIMKKVISEYTPPTEHSSAN